MAMIFFTLWRKLVKMNILFCFPLKLQDQFFLHMQLKNSQLVKMGFPGSLDGKESACNAGDLGLIPGLGRSPGEGNGNPFQYSCLENPMDRGAC